jgi:hypothetical protein
LDPKICLTRKGVIDFINSLDIAIYSSLERHPDESNEKEIVIFILYLTIIHHILPNPTYRLFRNQP